MTSKTPEKSRLGRNGEIPEYLRELGVEPTYYHSIVQYREKHDSKESHPADKLQQEEPLTEMILSRLNENTTFTTLSALLDADAPGKARAEALRMMSTKATEGEMEALFKTAEHLLASDEEESVRAAAVEVIVNQFADKGRKILEWAFENDDSIAVLEVLIDGFIDGTLPWLKALFLEEITRCVETKEYLRLLNMEAFEEFPETPTERELAEFYLEHRILKTMQKRKIHVPSSTKSVLFSGFKLDHLMFDEHAYSSEERREIMNYFAYFRNLKEILCDIHLINELNYFSSFRSKENIAFFGLKYSIIGKESDWVYFIDFIVEIFPNLKTLYFYRCEIPHFKGFEKFDYLKSLILEDIVVKQDDGLELVKKPFSFIGQI